MIDRVGSHVRVQTPEGAQYSRNTSHLKRYETPKADSPSGKEQASKTNSEMSDTNSGVQTMTNDENCSVEKRPVREKKMPKRLDDFVIKL